MVVRSWRNLLDEYKGVCHENECSEWAKVNAGLVDEKNIQRGCKLACTRVGIRSNLRYFNKTKREAFWNSTNIKWIMLQGPTLCQWVVNCWHALGWRELVQSMGFVIHGRFVWYELPILFWHMVCQQGRGIFCNNKFGAFYQSKFSSWWTRNCELK